MLGFDLDKVGKYFYFHEMFPQRVILRSRKEENSVAVSVWQFLNEITPGSAASSSSSVEYLGRSGREVGEQIGYLIKYLFETELAIVPWGRDYLMKADAGTRE